MEKELSGTSPESLKRVPLDIEKAFAVDIFESNLRDKQKTITFDPSDSLPYYDQMNLITANYITDAGVANDDDRYPQLYDVARKYSVDSMNDVVWQGGIVDPANPDQISTPGSWQLQAEQTNLFGHQIMGDGSSYVAPFLDSNDLPAGNPDKPSDSNPEKSIDELNTEIESLRKDVSMAYAQRMKVGVFRKKRKAELQSELDEKEALLAENISKRDDMTIEQLRSSGNLSDEEIVEKLAEQANEDLIAQANDQNAAMHIIPKAKESSGRFSKVKNWGKELGVKAQVEFANASVRRRLGYTALAAGGVMLAGVAAGGFGVAGAAGIVGTRVARSYALKRAQIYKTPEQPDQIDYKNSDGSVKTIDEFREASQTYRKEVISERIERGDKIKKRAVYGALVASAFIGVGLLEHTETGKEVIGNVKEYVKGGYHNFLDRVQNPDGSVISTDEANAPPLTAPPEPGQGDLADLPQYGPHNVYPDYADGTLEMPNTPQPEVTVPAPEVQLPPAGSDGGGSIDGFNIDQYTDAMNVAHGEGWYSTFGELGITSQADQAKLLNNDVLMAKLSNMNLAYVDNKIGGWGIRMPADGKMPADALKLIRETAQQSNLTLSR